MISIKGKTVYTGDSVKENIYVNYKGTTIKFAIKLSIGVAAFPQDGDDVYKLRDAAQKSLVEINCLCK